LLVALPADSGSVFAEQRRARSGRVAVQVERDRPGRIYPRPRTVALSAIEDPTVADAGCRLVLIDADALVIDTGSALAEPVTLALLLSPL